MSFKLTPNNSQKLSFERPAPVEFRISSITVGLPNKGEKGEKGDPGDPATNLVQSVNGKQGVVVLNATDVGADLTGSASQALQDAKDYTDTEVSTLDSSLATVAKTGSYNDLSNKPTIPSIAGLATEAQVQDVQDNLDAHEADTANPHSVTKAQVGLGNADDTSDADKPVSTAQQTALDGKADFPASNQRVPVRNSIGAQASEAYNPTPIAYSLVQRTSTGTARGATAVANDDLVPKAQMDAADALKMDKTGGTFSGSITAANLSGTNTGDETNATIKNKLLGANFQRDGYMYQSDAAYLNPKMNAARTTLSLLEQAIVQGAYADRTAFLQPSQIQIEQSTDAGATWTDGGYSDETKMRLFDSRNITSPVITASKTKWLRITIDAWMNNNPSRCARLTHLFLRTNTSGDNTSITVERATIGNPATFIELTNTGDKINTWPGSSIFKHSHLLFGGITTQTSNNRKLRITIKPEAIAQPAIIWTLYAIRWYGDDVYSSVNNMMANGNLYSWDENQNASFPAGVTTAGSFVTNGVSYLSGTGFPEGVISAPVGSIYIDKAITNGASSWIKKSGTGNTGWRVLEGDTGWRNIGNITGITEQIKIRRVGSNVYFSQIGDAITINSVVTLSRLALPPGFRSSLRQVSELIATSGAKYGTMLVKSTEADLILTTTGTATFIAFGNGSFVTNDSYPTTLPGTATT